MGDVYYVDRRFLYRNESSAVTRFETTSSPTRSPKTIPEAGTVLYPERYKYTWAVENFPYIREDLNLVRGAEGVDFRRAVKSPLFTTGGSQGMPVTHWNMTLHPMIGLYSKTNRLLGQDQQMSIGLHLQMQRQCDHIQQVVFVISLVNSNGERSYAKEMRVALSEGYFGENTSGAYKALARLRGALGGCCGWYDFIPRKTVIEGQRRSLMPNNTLTIRCDMTIHYKSSPPATVISDEIQNQSSNALTFVDDIRTSLQNQKDVDVVLRCGRVQLWAHKAILGARSPTLAKLLQAKASSNSIDTLDLPDVSGTVMAIVLDFIYGGDVVSSISLDLCATIYAVADKYCLFDLRQMCAKVLIENMTNANVFQMGTLADLHDDHELLTEAKKFITANSQVLSSLEWLKFQRRRPELSHLLGSM